MALDLSPTFEELGSHCPGSRGCRQPRLPALPAEGWLRVLVRSQSLFLVSWPRACLKHPLHSSPGVLTQTWHRSCHPALQPIPPSEPTRPLPYPGASSSSPTCHGEGTVSLSLDGSFQRGSPSPPSQVLFLLICSPDNLLYPVHLPPPIRTQITRKSLVLVSFPLLSGPVLKLVNQPERLS